jgi:Flp pilus assembly protein TadG
MMMARGLLSQLREQTRGSVVIVTAIVAPILILLSLGTFDAGRMVARQNELQSAAAEAEAIVQASVPEDDDAREEVRGVLLASTNPNNAHPATTVAEAEVFRCSTGADLVTVNNCVDAAQVSTFVKITLTDTYSPQWTAFGIGRPVNYNVVRMVQIS